MRGRSCGGDHAGEAHAGSLARWRMGREMDQRTGGQRDRWPAARRVAWTKFPGRRMRTRGENQPFKAGGQSVRLNARSELPKASARKRPAHSGRVGISCARGRSEVRPGCDFAIRVKLNEWPSTGAVTQMADDQHGANRPEAAAIGTAVWDCATATRRGSFLQLVDGRWRPIVLKDACIHGHDEVEIVFAINKIRISRVTMVLTWELVDPIWPRRGLSTQSTQSGQSTATNCDRRHRRADVDATRWASSGLRGLVARRLCSTSF